MYNHSDKVNFIWSVADLIRDTFKRSKYQDVILPLTVLRRIDCEAIEKLKEYSAALISAAVTGKIDVRGEVGMVGDENHN